MPVKARPDGYHTLTPSLVIEGAAQAIDFYKEAFGAEETMRFEHEGKVVHAEVRIGDSVFMFGEPWPDAGHRSPAQLGGSPAGLMIYVDDVDKAFGRAVAAGAKVTSPLQDHFYGDRSGGVTDPFGHNWTLATHKEDVPPEEMMRRFREMMAGV
jgi:PhnB protein